MKINPSKYRTANNYGINDFEIPEQIFDVNLQKDVDFAVNFGEGLCKVEKTANFDLEKEICSQSFSKDASVESTVTIQKFTIDPIEIRIKKASANANLKIVVKRGVSASINLFVESDELFLLRLLVDCQEYSDLKLFIVSSGANNLQNINVFCRKSSRFELVFANLTENILVQNFYARQDARSSCEVNTIYLGENEDRLDLSYSIDVQGENCTSNINCQGALDGKSEKHFKGIISFEKGARGCKANEKDDCLFLSKDAKAKSFPALLCAEEEVDGSHSSFAGSPDPKTLFYLNSRGLCEKEAKKLLIFSKFNAILTKSDRHASYIVREKLDF